MGKHKDTINLIATIKNGVECILDKVEGEDNTPMIRHRIALSIATFLLRFTDSTTSMTFDCDQSNNSYGAPYITVDITVRPVHSSRDHHIKCRVKSASYSAHKGFNNAMKGI